MYNKDLFIFSLLLANLLLAQGSFSNISVSDDISCRQQEKKTKPFRLSRKEKREGFKILFDGTNLDNWIDNSNQYVVEDGNIVMQPKVKYGGNLYTKEEYRNFVLRFEFLLTPGANNGLGLRHRYFEKERGYDGMELQILDDYDPKYKELEPYQYHGSLYSWVPAKRGHLKPAGEWNYQEVIMRDNHLKIILNGEVILDTDLSELVKNAPSGKEVGRLLYPKGHIAFLGHGDVLKFKHIRIKEIL